MKTEDLVRQVAVALNKGEFQHFGRSPWFSKRHLFISWKTLNEIEPLEVIRFITRCPLSPGTTDGTQMARYVA